MPPLHIPHSSVRDALVFEDLAFRVGDILFLSVDGLRHRNHPRRAVRPQRPGDNGYKPGFAAELMLKDLRLTQQAAESADADTPMGQLAQALYAQFVENDIGYGMDFSAMLPRFEKRGRDGKRYSGVR